MFNNLGLSARLGPISVWGINTRSGPISDGNGNALREIICQATFGDKCKFQVSHISHEKWVPSSQEYIPQRSTNMKIHPLIMTTPLREVYKQRQIVRGRGLAIFWGRDKQEKREEAPRSKLSTTKLKPSWEAQTVNNRIQIGPEAPSLGLLGWRYEVFPLQEIPHPS